MPEAVPQPIGAGAPAPAATASDAFPRPLAELLAGLDCHIRGEIGQVAVSSITADSRQAGPGALFVALPGLRVDGHRFVGEAIERGCGAVVVEAGRPLPLAAGKAALVEVADTREALGRAAAAFYGHPARQLTMIGITGTNGKTTSTYLLESMIRAGGGKPGVIGTVNYRYEGREWPAPFTTPDPLLLHRLLGQMAGAGVTHVIMEVSSHALAQKRLAGVDFDVAVFTNLSRDHLDFHGDMEAYFRSKELLFTEHLRPGGRAVIMETASPDHETAGRWGTRLRDALRPRLAGADLLSCGLGGENDLGVLQATGDWAGLRARLRTPAGELEITVPLVGRFNLENVLGAVGAGLALQLPGAAIQQGLAGIPAVPGRLERVEIGSGVAVFVDYAHTPAALENVLQTLREMHPARLIVLFGCGGDRDQGKRPLMGAVAAALADVVLLTSDNPRSEEPGAILAAIEGGIRNRPAPLARQRAEILLRDRQRRGYDVISSRREAIGLAVRYSQPGDVLLISGKGHENYQITRSGKTFFDDRLEVRRQAAVIPW